MAWSKKKVAWTTNKSYKNLKNSLKVSPTKKEKGLWYPDIIPIYIY